MFGVVAAVHNGPTPTVDLYLNGSQATGKSQNLTTNVKIIALQYQPSMGDVVMVARGLWRTRTSHVVIGKIAGSASPYSQPLGGIDSQGRYVSGPNAVWGGAGLPSATLGMTGDWFLQTDLPVVWFKAFGVWTPLPTGVTSFNGRIGLVTLTPADIVGAIAPGAVNNVLTSTGTAWASLPATGGSGAVSAVSNSDGTLTISPTTGAVVASRAALTGDVTASAGSNATTVAKIQGTTIASPPGGTTAFLRGDGTWAVPSGGSGTVTSASVVSANGFAGSVATATTTPAITLSTTITGVLKANGTAISAASAGTDYLTPSGSGASLTGITASQVSAVPTSGPANGYGITGNTGASPTPAVGLTTASTTLASNQTVTSSAATLLTLTLAVGTWLVTVNAQMANGAGVNQVADVYIGSAGTATYTVAGPQVDSAGVGSGSALATRFSMGFTCIVTVSSVTGGDTVIVQVIGTQASAGTIVAKGDTESTLPATGATAVRIA
jgi:hypothetical protein